MGRPPRTGTLAVLGNSHTNKVFFARSTPRHENQTSCCSRIPHGSSGRGRLCIIYTRKLHIPEGGFMPHSLQIHTIVSAPFEENTYVVWQNGRHDALVIDPG